jgi:hypothetical protein
MNGTYNGLIVRQVKWMDPQACAGSEEISEREYVVDGLRPGWSYLFTVAAVADFNGGGPMLILEDPAALASGPPLLTSASHVTQPRPSGQAAFASCVCVGARARACMLVCVRACMRACVRACVCVCVCICTAVCMCARARTHARTHTHTHTHTVKDSGERPRRACWLQLALPFDCTVATRAGISRLRVYVCVCVCCVCVCVCQQTS